MPSENTYRKKFNVKRLKDANTKETFELEIQNRFAILENEVNVDQDVNMLWNDTKKIYEETCESILGTTEDKKMLGYQSTVYKKSMKEEQQKNYFAMILKTQSLKTDTKFLINK